MIKTINLKINGYYKQIRCVNIKTIYDLFKKLNLNYKDYYIVYNNKLLHSDFNIENIKTNVNNINNKNECTLIINKKIKGGIISNIVALLENIVNFFGQLGGLITDLVDLIINIMELIPTIFTPDKLIDDVIYGVISGINGLFSGVLSSLTISGASASEEESRGTGAFGTTSKSRAVCVAPTYFNLLLLVLCPPLMLFIKKKWKGIILVVICALLTYYCYYFPGLIFAALHVLC